ncbi:MAG TPA: hypothetical protein VKQ72_06020 [Aggregatilineales bacterium]|nr:hypothetical protein [Aggregatilineales bacterium]
MTSLRRYTILKRMLLSAALAAFSGTLAGPVSADATPVPSPTFSSEPLTLTVSGNVASGTAGLSVPAGLQVTLHVVHQDSKGITSESVKRDSAVGGDATFSFDNVIAFAGDIALVTTTFQGTLQGSVPLQLQNGQDKLPVQLTLYGTTNDVSNISLLLVQHILDFSIPNTVQVLATYDYKNTGDRLYLSTSKTADGKPVSVQIPLPIGAQAIAFNRPGVFTIGGDINSPIVQDTEALIPGQEHQVVFSYSLPYAPGTPIDQDYPNKTNTLEVLIPDDANVGISNVRLDATPTGTGIFERSANNSLNATRTYTQYTLKSGLKAGDRLVYFLGKPEIPTLTPVPVPQISVSGAGTATSLILLVVIVGIGAGAAVIALRRGRKASVHNR